MNEEKLEFIRLLSEKVKMNDLYLACVDEVFDNQPFVKGVQEFPLFQVNLKHFVDTSKLLLTTYNPDRLLRWRDVEIGDFFPMKDELIHELNQLSDQYLCESLCP